jgi:quercetin dioxygenase-like cupin family protein
MTRLGLLGFVLVIGLMTVPTAFSEQSAPPPSAQHQMVKPGDIKWGPPPPSVPPGAQLAVLDGDPGKAGLFAIRLKFPDGYQIAPHWHPTDEHLTVLQGTMIVGMGDKVSAGNEQELATGGFVKLPAEMRHYARAKGETVVQIYGPGPFVVNYVNPSDDPQKKKQ